MSESSKSPRLKSRLGRGLSSLMSMADAPETPIVSVELPHTDTSADDINARPSRSPEPGTRVLNLPLADIVPNPHQPRRQFDDASLAELAASLKSTGLIQPIVVRPGGADGHSYELIAGERRWRAAKLADLSVVPAIVREVDSATQAQMALVENIQRQDLNPLDRALAYRTLLDQLGLTQAELAGRLGEERSTVGNFLRLLDLAEPVQSLVRDGKLSLGHAKLLAGVSIPAEQQRLAELVASQSLSVRNLERLIEAGPTEPAASSAPNTPPPPSAHLKDLERTLSRQLSLRVQVRTSRRKGHGKLILHYATLDQFDQLMTKLGIKAD